VSLKIVGDVFEVMAQVDRCLTKVNTVDLLIRVNTLAENLGRHTYPAKLAYEAQFKASYCTFNSIAIWKAKVEEKYCFFV
jgi:hypothetical protein